MGNKVLILDQERISRKLQRMAFQIWERHSQEQELFFAGIAGAGLTLARDLARRLESISPIKVQVETLTINKRDPLQSRPELSRTCAGKPLVLIDDVANSGKTLLHALRPLLDAPPSSIMVAVLVDRKHKSFPITPDIVGHSVATTLQEHIEVVCEGEDITAAYLQ